MAYFLVADLELIYSSLLRFSLALMLLSNGFKGESCSYLVGVS